MKGLALAPGCAAALMSPPTALAFDTITDFDLDDVSADGDAALMSVFLRNMGETQSLPFDMVLENDGWKVEDITSLPPGSEWQLSEIFAEAGIEAE